MRFEDRNVSPGMRYGYRLGLGPAGYEELTDEVWVSVPALEFALASALPNPSAGALKVAFTLPGADAAKLEVFDLAGRRVASRDVGAMGPGPHVVEFGDSRSIGAGVFWVRLTQGAR